MFIDANDNDFITTVQNAAWDAPEALEIVNSDQPFLRTCAAKVGKKQHLDILVNDKNQDVLREVIFHGHKEHLDVLASKDKWITVGSTNLSTIADLGHKEHLDILVDHPNNFLHPHVAKHGHKEHLDKLIHSHDICTKRAVAKYGDKEHIKILANSPFAHIRAIAVPHAPKEILDMLISDTSQDVLIAFAEAGHSDYKDQLLASDDPYVRGAALTHL